MTLDRKGLMKCSNQWFLQRVPLKGAIFIFQKKTTCRNDFKMFVLKRQKLQIFEWAEKTSRFCEIKRGWHLSQL